MGVVVQKMANLDGAGESDTAANTTEPFKGITVEDLNSKWKAAVLELSEIGINVTNADNALEGALSIRCGGTECNRVTVEDVSILQEL